MSGPAVAMAFSSGVSKKKHHFSFLGRMPQISHIGSGLPSGVPEPLTYKVVQLGARAHKQTESRI